jgi:hypothetical protein
LILNVDNNKLYKTKNKTRNKTMQGETKIQGKTSGNCQICLEKCNKNIHCGFCDFLGCKDCVKESILFSKVDPCCPKCKHAWDFEFCSNNLTKTFMTKEYREHKKELLFEIEKSKIPNTMSYVYNACKIEEIDKEISKKNEELAKIEIMWGKCKKEIGELKNEKNNIANKKEKRVFKKRCPNNDCNGFLTTKYKCYSCQARVCADCYEIKNFGKRETKEHVCNPDNVASFKAIKDETKSCPKCAIPIFKISGCDQMWCVECKVAFSWKSGMEVSGVIHNPHFYEWKRNNKESLRNVGEILCGGLPEWRIFPKIIKQAINSYQLSGPFENLSIKRDSVRYLSLPIFENRKDQIIFLNFLSKKWQQINHFQNYVLNNLRRTINNQDTTLKQRIEFIRNQIGEDGFKSSIMRKYRTYQKKLKILHIYEMFNVTTLETYNDIYHTLIDIYHEKNDKTTNYYEKMNNLPVEIMEDLRNSAKKACKKIYENLVRMDEILIYCNKELYKISKLYNQVVDFILPTFYRMTLKHDQGYFQKYEIIDGNSQKVSKERQNKYLSFECQWMLDLDTFDTMIDWKSWFPPNVRTRERERLLKNMEENDIENKDIMKNLLRKTF